MSQQKAAVTLLGAARYSDLRPCLPLMCFLLFWSVSHILDAHTSQMHVL